MNHKIGAISKKVITKTHQYFAPNSKADFVKNSRKVTDELVTIRVKCARV